MAYPNRDSFVKMKITLDVFEAYLKCSTKCWLRATNEPSAGGIYPEWVKAQNDSYRVSETQRLVTEFPNNEVALSPDMKNLKAAKWRLACNLAVQAQMDSCTLESELHALERVPAEGRIKPTQFIRFVFTNKLSKDDKLLLAFDASALSKSLGREVRIGRIVHGDEQTTLKVKTSAMSSEVRKRVRKNLHAVVQSWVARSRVEPALPRVRISSSLPTQGGRKG